MSLSQADILVSNNPAAYGVAYSDQLAGHRTVKTLTELYAIADCILSKSGDNTDDDAIGQEWYVSDEGCKYRLISWSSRNSAGGWEVAKEASDVSYSATITSGVLIGNLVVDGSSTPIYAPTAEEVPTYDVATSTTDGLMSASDKSKLDNIEAEADKTTVVRNSTDGTVIASVNGVDIYNGVSDVSMEFSYGGSSVTGTVSIGSASGSASINAATNTSAGLMSSTDKTNLDNCVSDVSEFETKISEMQNTIDTLTSQIATLQSAIAAITPKDGYELLIVKKS